VKPQDLIDVSESLAGSNKGKPKQAFLRRAVSTTYYALFHTLARCCADMLIGGTNADRSGQAWRQVYRSLEHGYAKNQCGSGKISEFPQEIQDFASLFKAMQTKRHRADYDPLERFAKSSVLLDIGLTKAAIAGFGAASPKDRRAFAAFVLLKARSD
jgi:hypothetical protein